MSVSISPGANAGMKMQVHSPTGPQLLHIALPNSDPSRHCKRWKILRR